MSGSGDGRWGCGHLDALGALSRPPRWPAACRPSCRLPRVRLRRRRWSRGRRLGYRALRTRSRPRSRQQRTPPRRHEARWRNRWAHRHRCLRSSPRGLSGPADRRGYRRGVPPLQRPCGCDESARGLRRSCCGRDRVGPRPCRPGSWPVAWLRPRLPDRWWRRFSCVGS